MVIFFKKKDKNIRRMSKFIDTLNFTYGLTITAIGADVHHDFLFG